MEKEITTINAVKPRNDSPRGNFPTFIRSVSKLSESKDA
jgi:hypothetical protein